MPILGSAIIFGKCYVEIKFLLSGFQEMGWMPDSEKVGLKLNIQKTKIMASGTITSWQIDGETVADFIFLASKITTDVDCSHEIKRHLLLGWVEVVKQEMARVNVDILGICELRWTRMGEFNSDDHYIYYCGQESLRRNGVAIIVNKSPKCSTQMQSQKQQNDFCSFPRQTTQYHSNPSLCPDQ